MALIHLRLRQQSLELIVAGTKTLEVRVQYPFLLKVRAGDIIRFNHDPTTDRRVIRIARYPSFEAMFRVEDSSRVNPTKTPEAALQGLKNIYPPHREALGALVFELAPP